MPLPAPCSNLLIGVTGSIHYTQLPQYLTAIKATFAANVRVIMTATAADMVAVRALELFTNAPVPANGWGTDGEKGVHIKWTRWADMFLVLPATANCLGKAANGVADDLVTTSIVSSGPGIVFAPAMNPAMWTSAAVRRNVATLSADGHHVIDPTTITSITSGSFDEGLGPTVDSLMPQLWHLYMRRLRREYWPRATATKPRSPSQRTERLLAVRTERASSQEQAVIAT